MKETGKKLKKSHKIKPEKNQNTKKETKQK